MSFLTAAHLMSKYGPLLTEDQLAEVPISALKIVSSLFNASI